MQSIMVKVRLIAFKIYGGIPHKQSKHTRKKSFQPISNPRHAIESMYTNCSARPAPLVITKLKLIITNLCHMWHIGRMTVKTVMGRGPACYEKYSTIFYERTLFVFSLEPVLPSRYLVLSRSCLIDTLIIVILVCSSCRGHTTTLCLEPGLIEVLVPVGHVEGVRHKKLVSDLNGPTQGLCKRGYSKKGTRPDIMISTSTCTR